MNGTVASLPGFFAWHLMLLILKQQKLGIYFASISPGIYNWILMLITVIYHVIQVLRTVTENVTRFFWGGEKCSPLIQHSTHSNESVHKVCKYNNLYLINVTHLYLWNFPIMCIIDSRVRRAVCVSLQQLHVHNVPQHYHKYNTYCIPLVWLLHSYPGYCPHDTIHRWSWNGLIYWAW